MSDWDLPEHISLIEKRRAKKLLAEQQKNVKPTTQLLERPWLSVKETASQGASFKIMTWNLLAQTLVRRDLFPTSDCLKASQRRHLLHEEIERQDADILCMQEVDTLDKLFPVLDKAGYGHRYTSGPFKKHGCLIAFKKSLFSAAVAEKTVFYDDEEVNPEGGDAQRIGKSFRTKNIGLIVGLQRLDNPNNGLVVATTHLFWHPRYTYERTRQAGILAREVTKFRVTEPSRVSWPAVLAGDFNFTPLDPAYSLLTTTRLNPEHEAMLTPSRVVHLSVDPSVAVAASTAATTDGDEAGGAGNGEEQDPDRIITNARPASAEDGLLDSNALVSLFSQSPQATSAYAVGLSQYIEGSDIEGEREVPIFGKAHSLAPSTLGFFEPAFTSYTHYWKSILDYIFVLTPDPSTFEVTGLLAPLPAKAMDPGLPQKKVCGSDHLPLVASLKFK